MRVGPRRRVLALLVGGAAAWAGVASLRSAARAPEHTPERAPRPESALDACIDAILPAGFGLPGALEVGVPAYVRRALADRRFEGVRRMLDEGARRLDAEAHARAGCALAAMAVDERLDLLASLAAPQAPDSAVWVRFCEALLDFTLEGYLGHPARGGNAGGAVFRALAIAAGATS